MENIKDRLDERLWDSIKKNYTSESYTYSILDSIQFVGDFIREKSGLHSDGVSLIGEAFGGKNPKIKTSALKTPTEKNYQFGMEQMLRGIYQAFRNTRSHSKYNDTREEAEIVICFINYLFTQIDNSKGKFSKDLFIKRINDDDFVIKETYIEILVDAIPKNKYFETAFEIFNLKNEINIQNLTAFSPYLLVKLNEIEIKELLETASEEIRYTESDKDITYNVSMFKEYWTYLDEDSRMRAENKLITCLKDSKYHQDNYGRQLNQEGIYALWLNEITNSLSLNIEFESALMSILSGYDSDQHRYILDYFWKSVSQIKSTPLYSISDIFNKKIKNNDKIFYEFAKYHFTKGDNFEALKDAMSNFVDPDDIPF